jgi:hypothetical protein
VPAAEELSPTLIALGNFAPEAQGFFEGLLPVIDRSSDGFPALRKLFRDEFPPLLRAVDPFLRNVNPILTGLGLYRRELAAAMANVAAATNAVHIGSTEKQVHYLRVMGPFTPVSLATFPNRLRNNRTSAYIQPGSSRQLARGLLNFETRQCANTLVGTLDPDSPNQPAFNERTEGDANKAADFFTRLKIYALGNQESTATVPAPGCGAQGPFEPIFGGGRPPTAYQHTFEQGGKGLLGRIGNGGRISSVSAILLLVFMCSPARDPRRGLGFADSRRRHPPPAPGQRKGRPVGRPFRVLGDFARPASP